MTALKADARRVQGEEHRIRDPVHLLAGRKGASDRSSASGAGVEYSADHAVCRPEAQ